MKKANQYKINYLKLAECFAGLWLVASLIIATIQLNNL